MPSLIVVGKKDGELELAADVTIIGRDRGVTLELGDFQVSRRHALVVRTDAGCFVKCLGSRNGVVVNKTRVPARREQKLKNGDVLTLGRTSIVFKDVVAGEPSSPQPPSVPSDEPKAAAPAPLPEKPRFRELVADDASLVNAAVVAANAPTPVPAAPRAAAPAAAAPAAAAPAAAAPPVLAPAAAQPAPAGADALAPSRDQVALRDLLRRAERERVFYRNLALGLVAFLTLVLVALLFYALGRARGHDESKPPKTGLARPGDDPGSKASEPDRPRPVAVGEGERGHLDETTFAQSVGPVLVRTCATAGCHLAPRGAGDLALEAGTDPGEVARNLAAVERFIVPGRPERSPLLTKPLRRDEGGEGHGGGDVLAAQSPAYKALREWIAAGAAVTEAPVDDRPRPRPVFAEEPPAPPSPVVPKPSSEPASLPAGPHALVAKIEMSGTPSIGTALVFDGSGSSDPGGCTLGHRWALVDRPDGSRVELVNAQRPSCSLTPDVAGSYLVVLVVSDGTTTSEPARASFEVPSRSPGARPTPAPAAAPVVGPLAQDANGRAYVREVFIDLLARGPRPDEATKALTRTRDQLVGDLLAREELYEEWYEQLLLDLDLVDRFRPATLASDVAKRLKDRQWTAKDALRSIVTSQAFTLRYAGGDAFAAAVLRHLVGLDPQDKQHRRHFDALKKMGEGSSATLFGKNGKSPAEAIAIALAERATAEHVVRRTYRRVTGIDAAPELVARGADRFEKDGALFEQVREWVQSPAYLERVPLLRTKSERAFARTLFLDALGRLPDEDELRGARAGLGTGADAGAAKAALAKLLVDSPRAKIDRGGPDEIWVTEQFRRLFAREPKTTELATYVKSLSAGTSRDVALRALLGSSEYEGY